MSIEIWQKKAMEAKTEKTRFKYIRKLRLSGDEALFEICVQRLNDSDIHTRTNSIEILSQFGNPLKKYRKKIANLFIQQLNKETNIELVELLLIGIGHNNIYLTSQNIRRILHFSESNNYKIRFALVFALLGIEDNYAIEILQKLSSDKSVSVRDWATFGLGSQIDLDNPVIRSTLWKRVSDRHFDTRMEAIVGLAKRQDLSIRKVIETEINNNNNSELIFEALEYL